MISTLYVAFKHLLAFIFGLTAATVGFSLTVVTGENIKNGAKQRLCGVFTLIQHGSPSL